MEVSLYIPTMNEEHLIKKHGKEGPSNIDFIGSGLAGIVNT
jgi:hypothetical protein